ncbi:cytochrome P450 [Actinomadura fibrosa]|uniref:Cytochrome P450 n=1 Tax=Actinomadura fibrosa TaxID=111802 RepID=A0ABW2Y0T0_9ACTN|nr:cytochrome P450 [Actinomadura fibrosa]
MLAPEHRALAGQSAVRVRLPEGQADEYAWLAVSAESVRTVYRHPAFSRAQADGVKPFLKVAPVLVALDGEEHLRIRRLVKSEFTPAKIRRLTPMIEARARHLVDAMRDRGHADLSADFAMPLTLETIAGQLGVPDQDQARFQKWGTGLLATGEGAHECNQAAMMAMCEYMAGLMAARRDSGTGDGGLLTMIGANAAATGVSDFEAALLAASLVGGGWESTASSIVTFTLRLLTEQDEAGVSHYTRLCAHPELIPGAIEELLRTTPNSIFGATQPRRALQDVDVDGVLVRAGEIAIPSIDAAALDEREFPEPERLDFGRHPNAHFAFGSGAHVCIGAPLAREELRIAFTCLTATFPGLRLDVDPAELEWKWDGTIRQPTTLPVTW